MGVSGSTSTALSPVSPVSVPRWGSAHIVPYDPDSDPLRSFSPVLAERQRRFVESATALVARRETLLGKAADLDRRAARNRRLHAKAKVALVVESVTLIALRKLGRPPAGAFRLLVHGGFAAWCRHGCRAALQEAAADAARAEAKAIDRRAGMIGLETQSFARRRQAAAAAAKSAIGAAGRALLAHDTKRARDPTGEKEDRRVADRIKKLHERVDAVRDGPVDARTGLPVIVARTNGQNARVRLMHTASKFKGGSRKGVAAIMAARAGEDDPGMLPTVEGQVMIAPERLASLRAQTEYERSRRRTPDVWDGVEVNRWLVGAYESLFRLPMSTRPREFGNGMPKPTDHAGVEWGDELARLTLDDTEAVPSFGRARLRMLGLPDQIDVDRMNAALSWATTFLTNRPYLGRAVGCGAMWEAVDLPTDLIRENVEDLLDLSYESFNDMRGEGLDRIAAGLNADGGRAVR